MIPEETRTTVVAKKIEMLRKLFAKTKFGGEIAMVPISANVGASEKYEKTENIDLLVETMINSIEVPKRSEEGNFMFLLDHSFQIKGQGTVLTGTVLEGKVVIGDDIEFPQLKEVKKVKSIQVFKKPLAKAIQGDRVGLLVTKLENKEVRVHMVF